MGEGTRRTIGLGPVESDDATIVEGDYDEGCVDGDQTVWVLEGEGSSGVGLAGISEAILGSRALAEVVGAKNDGVEVVGLVEEEEHEGIVFRGVGEGDTGWSYRVGEAQVEDEGWIVGSRGFADVGSADTEDMVVVEEPPEEGGGGVVVFAAVDGGGGGEDCGAIGPLIIWICVRSVQTAVSRPAGRGWQADVNEGGSGGRLEVDAGFLVSDARVVWIHGDVGGGPMVAGQRRKGVVGSTLRCVAERKC